MEVVWVPLGRLKKGARPPERPLGARYDDASNAPDRRPFSLRGYYSTEGRRIKGNKAQLNARILN